MLSATVLSNEVAEMVEGKLNAFDEAIDNHEFLEIDGDVEPVGPDKGPDKHLIKVINHDTEQAHSVTIDAIVKQRLSAIVRALESGVTTRLFGISRIVGYMSRINNWNLSKKAELSDRHKGSYKLADCKGL